MQQINISAVVAHSHLIFREHLDHRSRVRGVAEEAVLNRQQVLGHDAKRTRVADEQINRLKHSASG